MQMKLQLDNKSLKEILIRDYVKVQQEIYDIMERHIKLPLAPHQNNNHYVMEYNYLKPVIVPSKSLPLTDENGKFQYLRNIRNALETLLSGGDVASFTLGNFKFPYLDKLQQ